MGRVVISSAAAAPLSLAVMALVVQVADPGRATLVAVAIVVLVGTAVALHRLVGRAGFDRVAVAGAVGLLAPAGAAAWATWRLLGTSPAARLAWMLGEEDNAHVVGVARELLADGPGGAELAAQYGTSFATPGLALLRTGLAGPLTGDPRLDAITATTASAALLPLLVATAVLLAAIAVRTSVPSHSASASPAATAGALLGALTGGTAVQLLVVALPLQLGFATLAWAVAWVLVGWSAALGLCAEGLPRGTQAVLAVQIAIATVLLEGSWPFLVGALALPVAAVVSATLVRRLRGAGAPDAVVRARLRRWVAAGALAAVGAGAALLGSSGAVRTVLGLGREALTAGVEVGSSIVVIGAGLLSAAAAAAALVAVALRRRTVAGVVVAGPALGALATLVGVRAVAQVVADGIVGYGGSKVLLATVLLAVGAGAAVLAAGRLPWVGSVAAAAILALIVMDPLGRLATDWWDRTAPDEPPHAVATITALESSSAGLPVRCRPAPGTAATASARLAAYFCIVWMEDAFNEGPGSGNRFAFFGTEDATFDRVVAEAEADGLYGFAVPLRLGPGWFGWDGVS